MNVDRAQVAEMSLSELVALHNQLTGESVKRFRDRKAGLARVFAMLGEPKPAPATPAAKAPALRSLAKAEKAVPPPARPKVAPAAADAEKAGERSAAGRSHAAAPNCKPPRVASKRGQLLVLRQRPEGVSFAEMQAAFAWKPGDCNDALRLLAQKNGVGVACRADGRWRAV